MRVLYSLHLAIAKYVTRCCHGPRRSRVLISVNCFATLEGSPAIGIFCRDNRRSLRRSLVYAQYMGGYVLHATTSRRIYASCIDECNDDGDLGCHAASHHSGVTLLL